MTKTIRTLIVNGAPYEVAIDDHAILLDVIREDLRLTGTKRGCDMGTCGCCTVIVDGEARLSCLTLARQAVGRSVETVEGLSVAGKLHPVQEAFHSCLGSQCGFCTPGFVMATTAFLRQCPDPTRDEVKEAVSGNLCRCTGYLKIFEAVEQAAAVLRGEEPPKPREAIMVRRAEASP